MANPSGFNGITPPEIPYGEKQVQAAQQSLAPVPQPGVNAPQRAQRRAVRGQPSGPTPAPPPGQQATSPAAQVAQFWRQAASVPGASPLVQQLAMDAGG